MTTKKVTIVESADELYSKNRFARGGGRSQSLMNSRSMNRMQVQLPQGQQKPTGTKKAPANISNGSVENVIENMKKDENFVDPCTPSQNALFKKNVASLMREESVKILRENDNLDLKTYKPFIKEFYRNSGHMFEFDDNIFKGVIKDQNEVAEEKLKRSLKNEYRSVSKDPKLGKDG